MADMSDARNYTEGEILSFVDKANEANEADQPERMTGFFTPKEPGIRALDRWHRWSDVISIARVPIVADPVAFVEAVIERISTSYDEGISDHDRKVIHRVLADCIDDLVLLPPEPPQWTTVRLTYSNPKTDLGWEYVVRDGDLPGQAGNHAVRWTGARERFSWKKMHDLGSVQILPAPGEGN